MPAMLPIADDVSQSPAPVRRARPVPGVCGLSTRPITPVLILITLVWSLTAITSAPAQTRPTSTRPAQSRGIAPAADAPQPMTPAASAACIRLPDGFRIELVASEPVIQDPSCIAFDERGRLFVCELHGYNVEGHLDVSELNKTGVLDKKVRRLRWELMGGKIAEQARALQYGVVKLLSDSDGDGVMDRAEVWADDLPPCYGVLAARGGVIVVCAPHIIYLADTDDDGRVDVRETLYTGFQATVLERGINNPRWGLDNWIYVGAGRHAGTIRGPRLPQPVVLGNQDFRIQADGSAIEPVSGNVSTFGLAMNDIGDRFPCNGGQPAMYALPLPYRYLARNPFVPTPANNHSAANYARGFRISQPHPWRVRRGQDPAWVKFYGKRETNSSYFSGGCGGLIYRANAFPEKYRGDFFYCEPSLNLVHRCVLGRDGAGYTARRAAEHQDSEFLASTDQWFRPMNLRLGPDGAMYIVDMYREIIEDYSAIPRFLQQQYGVIKGDDRGRIWRLVADSAGTVKSGTGDRESLTNALRVPGTNVAEWSTPRLVRATGDSNPWWRHTAQRLLVARGDRSARSALAAQAHDGSTPAARLHALYTLDALRSLRGDDVRRALDDPHYGVRMHALRLADHRLNSNKPLLAQVAAMTDDPDPRVRLQLAMTLGASSDAPAIQGLHSLAVQSGQERWMDAAILSSVRESAGPLLVGLLRKNTRQAAPRKLLTPLAATLGGRRDVTQIERILRSLDEQQPEIQAACLTGFVAGLSRGTQPLPKSTDGWAALKPLLRSHTTDVQTLAIRLAARLQLTDSPELRAAFKRAALSATDTQRSLAERQRSIQLLGNAPFETVAAAADRLLNVSQPPALQRAFIQALGNSDDQRVAQTLFGPWSSFSPATRKSVLQTVFARENRIPYLLDALQNHSLQRGDLSALQREQLAANRNPELAKRARRLLKHSTDDAGLQQRIKRYQDALPGRPSAERGRQVFAKSCLACHQLKQDGFPVGPPLGSVTNKPDAALIRDLLDPSGHIESDYGTYIVVTTQGRTFTGVLASESATSVTLRKEKGATDVILRRDVETIKASNVSLMPADLHKQINPQQAIDLIAFLREAFAKPRQTDEQN